MSSKLSPPIYYEGNNIDEIIDSAYDKFKFGFMNKDNRPKYKDRFIFFNVSTNHYILNKDNESGEYKYLTVSLNKAERFYHIISIDKKESLQVFPCYNTPEYESCEVGCETFKAKGDFAHLNRVQCLYRLYRVHRISEVIELANKCDEHIEQWEENEKDKNGNKICKAYIRYTFGNDDYIVILKKKKVRGNDMCYEFITAFPVFLKRNKQQYRQAYLKHKKSNTK